MNSEEFIARVEKIRSMLYRVCCMKLYEPADREDAIQEAILKAWKNGIHYEKPDISILGLYVSLSMNATIYKEDIKKASRWKLHMNLLKTVEQKIRICICVLHL